MMTHKEALAMVHLAYLWSSPKSEIEAAIRAYIEARGLALVPREMTGDMRYALDNEYPYTTWENVLAAAPDPFAQEERS